jgi:hypothetical protein
VFTGRTNRTPSPIVPLYGTISNPYGIQPRLTGFVNQIYVQAVGRRQDIQWDMYDMVKVIEDSEIFWHNWDEEPARFMRAG